MSKMIKKTENEEKICDLVRKHLNDFPLFKENHIVEVIEFDKGKVDINYRSTKKKFEAGTSFNLNIMDETCYVLWIELLRSERGKGYGKRLYGIIENFAKDFGCKKIRLTPSGGTFEGKSRLEYMKESGYTQINDLEVEKILE